MRVTVKIFISFDFVAQYQMRKFVALLTPFDS
jgi:hypothetical protein